MRRPLGVLAALVAALVLVLPAQGWTPLTKPGSSVGLLSLATHAGTRLLVWTSGSAIEASRNGGAARTILQLPQGVLVQPVAVVQAPAGEVLLYYADFNNPTYQSRIFRVSSFDDGRTWRAPDETAFAQGTRIESVAMRPNGTPVFTGTTLDPQSDELWYLNVFQGRGGQNRTVIARSAHGSVGVTGGRAYVAYDTEAGTFVRPLDAAGRPTGRLRWLSRDPVALYFIRGCDGSLCAVYSSGSPLRILNLRTGKAITRVLRAHEGGGILEPVLDRAGRLWVIWIDSGRVNALRAQRVGAPFRRGGYLDLPLHRGAAIGYATVQSFAAFALRDGSLELYVLIDDQLLRGRLHLHRR